MTGIEDLQKQLETLREFKWILVRADEFCPAIVEMCGQLNNTFRNISTCFCKSSIPVMFCKSAIGQHLLGYPMCAKWYSGKNIYYSFIYPLSFYLSAMEAVL